MLIGLGYKKRSGKDTVGQLLADKYNFKVLSFAAPLKDLCDVLVEYFLGHLSEGDYQKLLMEWADTYGLARDSFAYSFLSEHSVPEKLFVPDGTGKYRKLLQYIGTDLIRDTYADSFWIDAVARQIDLEDLVRINCAITDVRFPNEKEFIERYGIAVRVDRDTGLEDTHASESALDSAMWSYIIDNRGSLEDLEEQVQDLYDAGLLEHL